MAGVKGKSGGARQGAGGPRKGAGRKPKQPVVVSPSDGSSPDSSDDALKLLLDIAFGRVATNLLQVRAAIAAVQYTHAKVGEGGKKDKKNAEAKKIAGRFAQAAPPRLVAAGGKRIPS